MPLLWEGSLLGLHQFEQTKLLEEITTFINIKSNKRLGKIAEDLFSLWISNQKRYHIVFKNLQIINQKQTIGELDVLLFDTMFKEYLHVELITKFYVLNPEFNPNDINAWIGPNKNDSLQKKVNKLINKQLPLLQHKVTQKKLKDYLPPRISITQKVLFKANLFVPLNFKQNLTQFNSKCIVGNYLTFECFKKEHQVDNLYFCPTKQDWLRFPETQKQWGNIETVIPLITQFMLAQQSLLVWTKNKNNYKRYLIVPYRGF